MLVDPNNASWDDDRSKTRAFVKRSCPYDRHALGNERLLQRRASAKRVVFDPANAVRNDDPDEPKIILERRLSNPHDRRAADAFGNMEHAPNCAMRGRLICQAVLRRAATRDASCADERRRLL